MIAELKELMRQIGIESCIVQEINPAHSLAGNIMDSADYPAFLDAIEERYGITVDDRYALKLKTLNDFAQFIELRTVERQQGRDLTV
jgi:acyl carrier protein